MAAASTVTILGLGNPLLDISVDADTALCTKYGLAMGNACLAEASHTPLYAEITTAPYTPLYVAGGATLNSIRVSQWISGSPPGYSAFVGSIGEDAFGAQLSASAQADGVATLFQTQPAGGKPTGTCAVLIQDKERSLCANLAAAEHLAAAHLDSPAVQAAVASAAIFYTAGFPLTHDGGAESALTLSKLAVEGGKTYALNLSAPFITQVPFFKSRLDGVFANASFVFGNETEAEAWGATHEQPAGASISDIAIAMSSQPFTGTGPRTVVITQGAKPTLIAQGGALLHTVEVPPVESIVDTNGAGDAFVGGFLAALSKGKPLDVCANIGNWAASVVIQRSGCCFDASLKCPLMA